MPIASAARRQAHESGANGATAGVTSSCRSGHSGTVSYRSDCPRPHARTKARPRKETEPTIDAQYFGRNKVRGERRGGAVRQSAERQCAIGASSGRPWPVGRPSRICCAALPGTNYCQAKFAYVGDYSTFRFHISHRWRTLPFRSASSPWWTDVRELLADYRRYAFVRPVTVAVSLH